MRERASDHLYRGAVKLIESPQFARRRGQAVLIRVDDDGDDDGGADSFPAGWDVGQGL